MRLFSLLFAIVIFLPAAKALACSCMPDSDHSQAAGILADPAVSVAEVLVRGVNPRIGQSMLEIRNTLHGGLTARDIRARFDAQTSCGVTPAAGKVQTLVIRAEENGTYSVVGECGHSAVLGYLKGGR